MFRFLTVVVLAFAPVLVQAQTLEDVRKDIASLSVLMQELREELLSTGNGGVDPDSVGTMLQRLNNLEAELSSALGEVETIQHRISEIVEDGTRRVGDLEFRLTELEGGDTSNQGTTPPLGGDTTTPAEPVQQFTSDEQRSFAEAKALFESENFAAAAESYNNFISIYPGGPLTSEAQYRRGHALVGMQDWGGAARSFLDSFSGAPDGPWAAESLFELSISLGALDQVEQACLTLDEIGNRYPAKIAEMGEKIASQKQQMSCP